MKRAKRGRASGSGQFMSVAAAQAAGDTATVETIELDLARAREAIVAAIKDLAGSPRDPEDGSQRMLVTEDELRAILLKILA